MRKVFRNLKDKQWAETTTYKTNQRLTSRIKKKKKPFKPKGNNRTMGIRYGQAIHKRKNKINEEYIIRWSKSLVIKEMPIKIIT